MCSRQRYYYRTALFFFFSHRRWGHLRHFSVRRKQKRRLTLLAAVSFAVTVNATTVNWSLWMREWSKRAELRADCVKIWTPCEPGCLQVWSSRSDHILITTCLHLELTCVFCYLDNLSAHRSHFNTRCKWGVSPFTLLKHPEETLSPWGSDGDLRRKITPQLKEHVTLKHTEEENSFAVITALDNSSRGRRQCMQLWLCLVYCVLGQRAFGLA